LSILQHSFNKLNEILEKRPCLQLIFSINYIPLWHEYFSYEEKSGKVISPARGRICETDIVAYFPFEEKISKKKLFAIGIFN